MSAFPSNHCIDLCMQNGLIQVKNALNVLIHFCITLALPDSLDNLQKSRLRDGVDIPVARWSRSRRCSEDRDDSETGSCNAENTTLGPMARYID